MHTYRACVMHARKARLAGDFIDRDWWLAEAMMCRWIMLGGPTWFRQADLAEWRYAR
jgi:hypothetical protein